jgi:hypothetical protein
MHVLRILFSFTLSVAFVVPLFFSVGCGDSPSEGVSLPPEEDPTLSGEDSTMRVDSANAASTSIGPVTN